ncbi:MAG: hypothetical protein DRJ31_02405 [Candidatus Methanomethylicota archaeon]|uniref:Roadblock/LAMTOR2 domain-containing protein n=1 Tax=Thermoproteota archaeon TaxID=2056631 RepID=A0A497ES08_9CREN|nr:MAG: hypothetical protein DRJ31_02405 [Candidatus Verstraetearchaeota archaeon]RLE52811.1 MAG: hypothetical protein DRJ33_02715 [Candidatus Verstraetearchaeota archaeon]
MSVCDEIMSLSNGIRTVRAFDDVGSLIEMKVREDITGKLFVPNDVAKEFYGVWFAFVSGVAENLVKYYGRLKRMALNFEKVDLLIVKEGGYVYIVSSDKNVLTTELAREIERRIRNYVRKEAKAATPS